MHIKPLLTQVGLETYEVEVYLALIQMKEGTAGQLAQKSGVPRTYAYKILESLQSKGFVQATDRLSSSVRRYTITDFEAPKRYIEQQQLALYRAQQEASALSSQLEGLANPQVSSVTAEQLKDQPGWEDFWRLLHSTISREIWVINPPLWWGESQHLAETRKWEQFRQKQHIWEKRFTAPEFGDREVKYTEYHQLNFGSQNKSAIILIDQYQVQVTNWDPFRAIRIESSEMVQLVQILASSTKFPAYRQTG